MKTVEAIINRFINEEGLKYNQERDDWVIEAMEEYAKEARIEPNNLLKEIYDEWIKSGWGYNVNMKPKVEAYLKKEEK